MSRKIPVVRQDHVSGRPTVSVIHERCAASEERSTSVADQMTFEFAREPEAAGKTVSRSGSFPYDRADDRPGSLLLLT